jgi:hypothetical protein
MASHSAAVLHTAWGYSTFSAQAMHQTAAMINLLPCSPLHMLPVWGVPLDARHAGRQVPLRHCCAQVHPRLRAALWAAAPDQASMSMSRWPAGIKAACVRHIHSR